MLPAERIDEFWGTGSRTELLHVLRLPDFGRLDAIGTFHHPETRTFGELLIDLEEDRTLRAVLVGMLKERHRGRWPLS